ncbi:DUF2268 domain-containing protein [Salmonella sp. NW805]|uniref:DUF2268 domain-containing putative Zn-dependent protease n=1 Tax=unclassified Salmonella TaxID=2614656 RepID=UPI003F41E150
MLLPSVDVIFKTSSHVIPEKGHLGYAPEPGVIFITVDPANPVFCENPRSSLERMFAHELHHAARWAGPGYEKHWFLKGWLGIFLSRFAQDNQNYGNVLLQIPIYSGNCSVLVIPIRVL